MITDERKQALIEKYRQIHVEDNSWVEDIERGFGSLLFKRCNMLVREISFNLWDQWATFETSSVQLYYFLLKSSLIKKYPEWEFRYGDVTAKKWSRYHAEQSVEVVVEDSEEFRGTIDNTLDDPFKEALETALFNKTEETYASLVNDIQFIIEEMNNKLYDMLEKEYEYLTSDEVIWETIIANEWDKDEQE